ncbi:DUF4433 domain-containing protein [Kitasatospora sp. NPDC091335]|uniref:type II toxin-antitoxin system toxin DNA ADP-ribosyl transferase DarT n=1 Tax=Kitasatospora sp. NPDC091335 TaxID=3364085 RepID=UPI0037FFB8E5
MTIAGGRQLFHFTHMRNLPSIFNEGRLVSDTTMQGRGGVLVECGDTAIKSERRTRPITTAPKGVPADYVPFYFAPRSPMLYKINKGGVPTYQDGQQPLVYLITSIDSVRHSGRPFVFSDGNCASAITKHFSDLDDLDRRVDWSVIEARTWANTAADGDRMRRRMAEFLVHEFLPIGTIQEIGTYDQARKRAVEQLLQASGIDLSVTVRRDWYF